MQYLGDYTEDYATLNFKFSTHKADGTPATLSGTPAISVYKANGATQSTAGITLSADFDSVTGLNNVLIDLSADAFYAVANDYQVVITTGTVDSVSVVGTVLAHFSIENRFNEVDVTKISGDSTAADNLESACDNYSTTRGLSGTALPNATANSAGGLPISDAGGLDLDTKLANTNEITVARMGALTDWINGGRLDLLLDAIKAITDQINFTGTYVNSQIKGSDNIDFGALQKTSLNSATPSVIISDKTGFSLSSAGVTAVQSGLSTLTAQQVWEYATRTLSSMGTLVSDIWEYATRTLTAFSFSVTASSVTDKTGYSLSVTPPTAEQIRTEIDSNSTQLSAIKAKTDNLPSGIKKGVAISNFVFLMKDSSDHVTGKTGLTITGQILKDNGSFSSISGTITEIAYGAYRLNEISATETNADIFTLRFSATGADDTFVEIKTI